MAGLIDKDLRLISKRKQSFFVFIIIALVIAFSSEPGDAFILGYVPMVFTIMATSTIAYDDHENGMTFLFTLPVEPKTYVRSKYVLSIAFSLAGLVIAAIMHYMSFVIHSEEFILVESMKLFFCFIPVMGLFISLLIPIQIKYGVEQGRMVMFIVFGLLTLLGIFIANSAIALTYKVNLIMALDSMSDSLFIGLGLLFTLIVLVISYQLSIVFLKNKEL